MASREGLNPSVPTVAALRRFTGEPFLNLDPAWLRAAFSGDRNYDAIARWRNREEELGLDCGSRRGLVGLWEVFRMRARIGIVDPAMYAAITASVWIEGKKEHACREFEICEPAEMVDAMAPFAGTAIVMSAGDLAAFSELPAIVIAFRGGKGPEEGLSWGSSWTTDHTVAQCFADHRPGGIVIEQAIPKTRIIALFGERKEAELVVRSPQ